MDAGNIDNLLGMAASAELAENATEAISYYNRVLEVDPTISRAWLGKGRAAGSLSTLAQMRTVEVMVLFGHAIASAAPEERDEIVERAAADAHAILMGLYKMAMRHYADFVALPTSEAELIGRLKILSDAAEKPLSWKPDDVSTLVLTTSISRSALSIGVSPALDALFRSRMDKANAAIVALVPDYVIPGAAGTPFAGERPDAAPAADAKAQAMSREAAWFMAAIFTVIFLMAIARATS